MKEAISIVYCIYYKKSDEDLRFDKEEHIIPAGLGGIQKLEKGTVSDEANEKFSKLETVALRNSFIAINRMNFGPGKRGSLNVKKIKSPVMRVLKQEGDNVLEFVLGFIFAGQSYFIPQIILDFDDEDNSFIPYFMSTILNGKSIEDFPLELIGNIIEFLESEKREFKLVHMPFETNKHFINIGYYERKWYAATSHKTINMDLLAENLLLPMLKEMKDKSKEKKEFSKPEILSELLFEYKDQINTDAETFHFLYLKTAFNALTFFKGTDFVCNEIFDEIRESIIKLSNLHNFIDSEEDFYDTEIEGYVNNIPEKAHYVFLCAKDNRLIAYVSFYGEFPGKIKLTDKYEGNDFIEGLICDWKNRKEFQVTFSKS
ncbi:hypothetical protein ABS315_20925 [Peribacillus frigoritolerans]|uniref:hypothetical protein n=1 Tax=Peribacillus frigoritolerans TaxID=450367 RepID=UPI0034E0C092